MQLVELERNMELRGHEQLVLKRLDAALIFVVVHEELLHKMSGDSRKRAALEAIKGHFKGSINNLDMVCRSCSVCSPHMLNNTAEFVKVAKTVANAVVLKRPWIPLFFSSLTTGGISLV